MPAHSLNLPAASRRPLATRLAAGLCAALLGSIAAAADVLVVTDSRHPVQAPAGVRIIELDQATRIEVELAAHLPADPQQAAAVVVDRRYVVYGEPDVLRAVARINAYRSAQP